MTRKEAKIKIKETEKNMLLLNMQKEKTKNISKRINLIYKITSQNYYIEVLEAYVQMDNIEYENLKEKVKKEYEIKKEVNRLIATSLLSGNNEYLDIPNNKIFIDILKEYKEILKKIKIKDNKVKLVA